jgi:GNAT superfamily N-acetyltransferase
MNIRILDVTSENIGALVVPACAPRLDDPNHASTLKEGGLRKKEWIRKALQRFGSCAKVALLDDKPVGFVEFYPMSIFPFLPKRDKRTLLITCILVHDKTLQKKGIGSKLVQALVDDLKHRSLLAFNGLGAEEVAVGSWGCHVGFPESLPRFRSFFLRNGFVEDPDFPDPTGKGGILVHRL